MRLLDLCCGLKGASREFEKAGWDVTTVDIDPKFNPSIVSDVNNLHLEHPGYYNGIWASPPCTDYSKDSLPSSWKCNGGKKILPDMRPFLNCYRIIRYLKPKWWIIENVRGAIPYFSLVLGKPTKRAHSRILWGEFPIFDSGKSGKGNKWRLPPTEDRAAIRSEIPIGISRALCMATAQQAGEP